MKALTLYRPVNFEKALSDFDCYLESFFGDSFLSPADRIFKHLPAVDIRENENAYFLEMELPGYDEKNVEVHLDGGTLTVESKKDDEAGKDETRGNSETYYLRERRSSSFSRSFKLPENADPDTVSAVFKNGILTLEIKKRAESQKRLIRIEKN